MQSDSRPRSRIARIALCAGLASLALHALPARADDPPLRTAEQYRGRPARSHPGRAWLWVPRVLLFPLYAVAEFGIRQPVLATGRWVEHAHVGGHIARAMHPLPGFAWGPSFDLDFGLRSSFGLAVRWDDPRGGGTSVSTVARSGGDDVWYLAARAEAGTSAVHLGLAGRFAERPDAIYGGNGGVDAPDGPWRYRFARADVAATLGWTPSPHLAASSQLGLREDATSPGENAPPSALQSPPQGMGQVRTAFVAARIALDSRTHAGELPGVRMNLGAHYGSDLAMGPWQFVVADAELTGAFALPGGHAALGAMTYLANSAGTLPFTEQPTLGGERFRGFLPGRIRGDSALAAEVQLRVDVNTDLDAVLAAGVGNAFGRDLAGFDARALMGETWFALRSRTDPRGAVELLIGAGTRRFDNGFDVDEFRIGAALNRDLF